ncbi:MAG: hypothetical protein SVV03_05935 [Candidatus Nanohaloarchaea archaeon]|nr:hypothetical protein [Candidatus Nanohaloarchaea archaeon]
MTGEPEFTFRGTDETPECKCGEEMEFEETREDRLEEVDVYICRNCGKCIEDKWSF